MGKVKDLKSLLEGIQMAVSEYACDYCDENFELEIQIRVHNGWVDPIIVKKEEV